MELKGIKFILLVNMTSICLCLLIGLFTNGLKIQPLLPSPYNKSTQFQVNKPDGSCNQYKMSKHIMQQLKGKWSTPIVVPKYKLVFFWNEKAACTYWKRLFQFIQGINKTAVHGGRSGLTNLRMFDNCAIMTMMHSDQWVKAVFVREPRERILSAYLDKGQHRYFMNVLCRINRKVSFYEFLEIIKQCKNGHWDTQFRVPKHFYQQMMIGKFSEISQFTERLLQRIGAWNETVEKWIKSNKHIYQPHATNATTKLLTYYKETWSQDLIFDLFSDDYHIFGFDQTYLR